MHRKSFIMKQNTHEALGLLGAALLAVATSACAPATMTASGQLCDRESAQSMAKKDHCLACHSSSKQKKGPSYQAIAVKYRGNPSAEAELYGHLTTGDVANMSDGKIQYHKRIAGQTPGDIRNMVRWILDQ
jgi:cytochrome c